MDCTRPAGMEGTREPADIIGTVLVKYSLYLFLLVIVATLGILFVWTDTVTVGGRNIGGGRP